jgi:murein DD-endopeptidase MepM/ murein hydrolase activator NlpD
MQARTPAGLSFRPSSWRKAAANVVVGARVSAGQAVGECGNSGNTSQPRLHLQVQSGPDVPVAGVRTFPVLFRDVVRRRGETRERLRSADLRRNDLVKTPRSRRAAAACTPKIPASSTRERA